MDVYVSIMYGLSTFGFFVIFFSMYLLITVPSKLTPFTRFVIHGHDITSGIAQLYLTLGTIPYVLFPCVSGYPKGLLSGLGMSTLNQFWSQTALIAVSVSFSMLLTINRTFGVCPRMSRWKKQIVVIYFGLLFCQIVFLTFAGIDVVVWQDVGLDMIFTYIAVILFFYVVVGLTCVTVLLRSISVQAKSSKSAQFLANQRRITIGVVYFVIVEIVGLAIPSICIAICGYYNVGRPVVSHYAFISISFYPIFGPYYVLMSNKDYRNRVDTIIKRWYPQRVSARIFQLVR